MMKLFAYEHCPYCVRVVMGLRLKKIPFEVIYLANDDEETPRRMVGRKVVPILETQDGFLVESLDILRHIDALSEPKLIEGTPRPDLLAWLENWKSVNYALVLPRVADPVFPEFARHEARVAFRLKKEQNYGSFDAMLARTEALRAEMEQGYAELTGLLPQGMPGIDDIMLFPFLRSLSIVPGLTLPPKIASYRERISALTGIEMVQPSLM